MAQYFYDFKDYFPDGFAPKGMSRIYSANGLPNSNFRQYLSRDSDGLLDYASQAPAGTGDYSSNLMYGPTAISAADVQCLAKVTGFFFSGSGYSNDGPQFQCRLNVAPGAGSPTNAYEAGMGGALNSTQTFARKRVGGTNTTLGGFSSGGLSRDNQTIWIRWEILGSTLRARYWLDGTSEPGTWNNTVTDTDLPAAGYFAFGFPGVGTSKIGRMYKLHQLSFGTGGDPAPSTLPRTVAGTLLKPDNSPADGYLVRCFARDTGQLLAETLANSIGAFAFTLGGYTKPVTVVGVDQLGNTWNAVVKDLINPGT
ncbi:hypothetical protein Bhz59_00027 [Stenotrophomonas phage vB_SmaS_Bhz59]